MVQEKLAMDSKMSCYLQQVHIGQVVLLNFQRVDNDLSVDHGRFGIQFLQVVILKITEVGVILRGILQLDSGNYQRNAGCFDAVIGTDLSADGICI